MKSTEEHPSERTVKEGIPRPPLFFLPKHFWLPGSHQSARRLIRYDWHHVAAMSLLTAGNFDLHILGV